MSSSGVSGVSGATGHPEHGRLLQIVDGHGRRVLAKRFVLDVYGDSSGDIAYAVQDMTASDAKSILRKAELFQDLKKVSPGLTETRYGDSLPFFEDDSNNFNDDDDQVRISTCDLVIADKVCLWEAWPKNADIRVSTGEIALDDVRRCVEELSVELSAETRSKQKARADRGRA